MSAHHLLKETEIKNNCLYCGENFDPSSWETHHNMKRHYKINHCSSCHRTAKIEVDFEGSGHDSWSSPFKIKRKKKTKGKISVIESPLEKAIKEN